MRLWQQYQQNIFCWSFEDERKEKMLKNNYQHAMTATQANF